MTARSSRWMWIVCAALVGASSYACEEKKTDGGGTTAPSTSASTTTASTATVSASASASAVASADKDDDDDDDKTAGVASAAPSGSASGASSATAKASASVGGAKSASGAFAPGTCGGKDQPKCPLQAWMAANMQPAMAAGDATKLAAALRASAKFAPPGYGDWAKIATDGAAAVDAAKDAAAGKPACKSCHGEYQKRYRTEMRERPI